MAAVMKLDAMERTKQLATGTLPYTDPFAKELWQTGT